MPEMNTVPDAETIASAIKGLVADVSGQPANEIDDSTGLDALGIDSLLIVEVVVGIQRKFGVQVPPSEFRGDIRTVGDVSQALGAFVHARLSSPEPIGTEA